MKKQILNFTLGTLIAFFLVACGNDKPTTPATKTGGENTVLGATGIPAIDNLSQQIAKNPDDHTLYAARANEFYKNEGYDGAIKDMAYAMKIDSTNADYHHLLADIYLDYYKSRLALQTMKRCVALYPERIPSLLKLAEFQQILEQYDAAMVTVGRIMKIDPNNPEAFFMLGVNHTLMGNKPMAIKSLQKAVEIDPEHFDAYVLLGNIFEEDKDPLAEQYYENAVLSAPQNTDVLYSKATYLHNSDKLDEAANILRNIIAIDRNYVDAYQRMGIIYIEKDSISQAYENFNIAVNVDPQYGNAYFYRGYTSELLGNFQAAQKDYQTILNIAPDYQKAQEGLARVNKVIGAQTQN